MASTPHHSWSFRQRFSWRASTLLLAYLAAFAGVGALQPWLPGFLGSGMAWVQETLGPGALIVWFPAAVLAFAFFIGSLLQRNPQIQFLCEVVLAFGVVLLTPTY